MNVMLQTRIGRRLMGRVPVVVLVIMVGTCGSFAYASGAQTPATASGVRHTKASLRNHFSVLTHPSRLAQRAAVGTSHLPAGAILAEAFRDSALYVSEETSPESSEPVLCLTELEASGGAGRVCGASGEVEQRGLFAENVTYTSAGARIRIDMLMPNGTSNVVVIDNHGEQHGVALHDNVAQTEYANVEKIQYAEPDGSLGTVAFRPRVGTAQP
jgi:hypothetical protein